MIKPAPLYIYPRTWMVAVLTIPFKHDALDLLISCLYLDRTFFRLNSSKHHKPHPSPQYQTRTATPMHPLRRLLSLLLVLELLLLVLPASNAATKPTCSNIYGSPAPADCAAALAKLPRDTTIRYFVEQQMRTAPPAADWIPFVDTRGALAQPVSQLPIWWSHGRSHLLRC